MLPALLQTRTQIALKALLSLILALSLLLTACGDISTPTAPASLPITTASISPAASATSAVTTAPATTNQATTAAPATALPTPTPLTSTTAATPSPSIVVNTSPAATTASSAGADGFDPDETEVSFNSGQDKLYGTLLVPNDGKTLKKPAALLATLIVRPQFLLMLPI